MQISGNAPLAWYKNDADPSSKKVRKYADVLLLNLYSLIDFFLQS